MLIRGKVNFAQKSENVENRYDITFSIHELTEKKMQDAVTWLTDNGIKVTEYQNKKTDEIQNQVRCTLFKNCPITFIENEERITVEYSKKPLIYNDLCVFKLYIGEYTYKKKKGNALRCNSVALIKPAQRGGFSDEEMESIFG